MDNKNAIPGKRWTQEESQKLAIAFSFLKNIERKNAVPLL